MKKKGFVRLWETVEDGEGRWGVELSDGARERRRWRVVLSDGARERRRWGVLLSDGAQGEKTVEDGRRRWGSPNSAARCTNKAVSQIAFVPSFNCSIIRGGPALKRALGAFGDTP